MTRPCRILGEYAVDPEMLSSAFTELITNIGSPPFIQKTVSKDDEAAAGSAQPAKTTTVTKSVVLSDGTYATQVSVKP